MTIHNRHVLTCSAIRDLSHGTYTQTSRRTATHVTSRHLPRCTVRSSMHTTNAAHAAAPLAQHNGYERRPPTGSCMRPQTGLPLVHDLNADGRRCRGPLPVLRDRQTFDSSRKCPAHMGSHGSSDIDHRCTHVSLTIGRMAHGRGWQRGTARQGRGGEAGGAPEKYSSKRLSAACKKSQLASPS